MSQRGRFILAVGAAVLLFLLGITVLQPSRATQGNTPSGTPGDRGIEPELRTKETGGTDPGPLDEEPSETQTARDTRMRIVSPTGRGLGEFAVKVHSYAGAVALAATTDADGWFDVPSACSGSLCTVEFEDSEWRVVDSAAFIPREGLEIVADHGCRIWLALPAAMQELLGSQATVSMNLAFSRVTITGTETSLGWQRGGTVEILDVGGVSPRPDRRRFVVPLTGEVRLPFVPAETMLPSTVVVESPPGAPAAARFAFVEFRDGLPVRLERTARLEDTGYRALLPPGDYAYMGVAGNMVCDGRVNVGATNADAPVQVVPTWSQGVALEVLAPKTTKWEALVLSVRPPSWTTDWLPDTSRRMPSRPGRRQGRIALEDAELPQTELSWFDQPRVDGNRAAWSSLPPNATVRVRAVTPDWIRDVQHVQLPERGEASLAVEPPPLTTLVLSPEVRKAHPEALVRVYDRADDFKSGVAGQGKTQDGRILISGETPPRGHQVEAISGPSVWRGVWDGTTERLEVARMEPYRTVSYVVELVDMLGNPVAGVPVGFSNQAIRWRYA